MPTASGPNTLGESNLIFAYDTGDVKNSYKGQPTVNAFGTYPNYPTDLYNWAYSGNACTLTQDTISSPVGNTPLKMVTTGNDAYTGTYGSSGWNISAASSGQTWTISVWAKANQNTTGQIFHFGANSSGDIIDFSATTISLTTEWTRYTYTRTFTDGNVVAIQARLDGPDTFQSGVVVWWDGLQVEQKAYATQFVDGTRSATQGLLDLTGNRTIDLTNVSFNSNAQMVFDGTNDYIESPATTLSGDFTVSQIVNLASSANGPMPIGGGYYANGSTYQGYVWFRNSVNQVILAVDGELTVVFSVSSALWVNKTIMYTVRRSGSTATFYINGTEIATGTISTNNFNIRTIGYSYSTSYVSNGTINNTFIYNRALTPLEIKQNYQQYLTRFNLS